MKKYLLHSLITVGILGFLSCDKKSEDEVSLPSLSFQGEEIVMRDGLIIDLNKNTYDGIVYSNLHISLNDLGFSPYKDTILDIERYAQLQDARKGLTFYLIYPGEQVRGGTFTFREDLRDSTGTVVVDNFLGRDVLMDGFYAENIWDRSTGNYAITGGSVTLRGSSPSSMSLSVDLELDSALKMTGSYANGFKLEVWK